MSIRRLSHIGICVADLERARRLYQHALGFQEEACLRVAGEPHPRLLSLSEVELEAVYLLRDGTRMELLHFVSPGHETPDVPRPMNRLGLTHLSLRVSDLEATLEGIRRYGGAVLEETRIGSREAGLCAIFVLDPDGTRIELFQAPGDPEGPPLPPS